MAKEKALEKLEELLKCSVCLDDYTDPRLLPCSHIYCRQCLTKVVDREPDGRLVISCPICREVIPVPSGGVAGFQSAYRINSLFEIHKTLTEVKDYRCSMHGKELDHYCFTCEELLCGRCAKHVMHSLHTFEEVDMVFSWCKRNFSLAMTELLEGLLPEDEGAKTLHILKEYIDRDHKIEAIKMSKTVVEQFKHNSPNLPCCLAIGPGLNEAELRRKTIVLLQAIEIKEQSIEGVLVSELTGAKVNCAIEKREWGMYELTYQPRSKGTHYLNIIVDGLHVKGSPFSVTVGPSDPYSCLTYSEEGRLCGISISKRGRVIFSEEDGHCIHERAPHASMCLQYGCHGSSEGQFDSPRGIAVDGEGNILVADSGNHRIQKITAEGRFLGAVGKKGNGRLQFSSPSGITFNPVNQKVYVVDKNHRVQVLNSDLTFSSKVGSYGTGQGQFNDPNGIACDSTGKVYVADTRNNRIQVFTAELEFLTSFNTGRGMSKLRHPSCITFNRHTDELVVGLKDNISVFTLKGRFVQTVTPCPHTGTEIGNSRGLAADSNFLYVCTENSLLCITKCKRRFYVKMFIVCLIVCLIVFSPVAILVGYSAGMYFHPRKAPM